MKKKRDSFVVYRSFWNAIKGLPSDIKVKVLEGLMDYGFDRKLPENNVKNDENSGKTLENIEKNLVNSYLSVFIPVIESSQKRYDKCIINGKKGGRPPVSIKECGILGTDLSHRKSGKTLDKQGEIDTSAPVGNPVDKCITKDITKGITEDKAKGITKEKPNNNQDRNLYYHDNDNVNDNVNVNVNDNVNVNVNVKGRKEKEKEKEKRQTTPPPPSSKILEGFKMLYFDATKQEYRERSDDLDIISSLLAQFPADTVTQKISILFSACYNASLWFTKDGFVSFTVHVLSSHWNEILPDKVLNMSQLERERQAHLARLEGRAQAERDYANKEIKRNLGIIDDKGGENGDN